VEAAVANRPQRGYVDTPDGQIHFRRCGAGRPVVLLHQAPSSSSMWMALLPELAARGRLAIAFDLPGYGMSDSPPTQPDLAYYARRIEQAAAAMGLEKFDLVGHHTGSCVALWLASAAPHRVGRVVGYGLAQPAPAMATDLADEPPPDYETAGAEVSTWWQVLARYLPPDQFPTLAPRYLSDMLLSGVNRAFGHRAVGRANFEPIIRALTVPVLAVAGRNEILHDVTRQMAGRSPLIEFHEFGAAGIFAADEFPGAFAQLIHEFLSRDND
jgi:pimeloyl-ACP methyl ester carboxylesterase